MMSRRFIFALICLMAFLSCTNRSWEGVTDEQYDDLDKGDPVPVVISMGGLQNGYVKGSGAVDAEDGRLWKDVDVYVYAFRKDAYSYLSLATGGTTTLVDASLDFPSSKLGRRAFYDGSDGYVTWADSDKDVFYPLGKQPYDFFAYYIDDLKVPSSSVSRNGKSVSFPVEIDGSRDLMSAHAEFSDDLVAGQGFSQYDILLMEQYAFSSWTARRNVNPSLQFKHHLSRLRFEIYPASEGANTVYVNQIKVKSKTSARFTVASGDYSSIGLDFGISNVRQDLSLCEQDGSALKKNTYHTEYEGDFSEAVYERPGVQVGGTILVAPDSSYEVALTTYEAKEGGVELHPTPFTIKIDGGFKAGQQYVVRLAVYGMMAVKPTVEVEAWGTGGNIILDEEDKYYK